MRNNLTILTLLFAFIAYSQSKEKEPFAHTFSIIAIDKVTGDMAIGVQSHWFSVGTSVSWGEAGVGVIATQALVNFDFGPKGLLMLKEGKNANEVLQTLLSEDPGREMRQLAILDKNGNVAVNTGATCVEYAGHTTGDGFSVQANFADNDQVWGRMAKTFETSNGDLGDRIIKALEVGLESGGDIRGKQSASLLIVRANAVGKPWIDRKVDLRVDDSAQPLEELKRLYVVHKAYDLFNKGSNALMKRDLVKANQYFNEAQTLYPDNVEMTFWFAVELANMGNMDASLDIFSKIFAKDANWKTVILPRIRKAGLLNVTNDKYNQIINL